MDVFTSLNIEDSSTDEVESIATNEISGLDNQSISTDSLPDIVDSEDDEGIGESILLKTRSMPNNIAIIVSQEEKQQTLDPHNPRKESGASSVLQVRSPDPIPFALPSNTIDLKRIISEQQ